jgi:hypothetical protein
MPAFAWLGPNLRGRRERRDPAPRPDRRTRIVPQERHVRKGDGLDFAVVVVDRGLGLNGISRLASVTRPGWGLQSRSVGGIGPCRGGIRTQGGGR